MVRRQFRALFHLRVLTPLAWAGLVLAVALGLTAYLVQTTQHKIHAEEWARFQREVDRVEADIQAQFESLLPALRGRGRHIIADQESVVCRHRVVIAQHVAFIADDRIGIADRGRTSA